MCSIPTQPQIPAFAMNMNFVTSAVKDNTLRKIFSSQHENQQDVVLLYPLITLKVCTSINFARLHLSDYCLQFITTEKKPVPDRMGKNSTDD